MTTETAMRRIHKRVMDHIAVQAKSAEAVDTADPATLRRIDGETADENERFTSDITDIAVKWKEAEKKAKGKGKTR